MRQLGHCIFALSWSTGPSVNGKHTDPSTGANTLDYLRLREEKVLKRKKPVPKLTLFD